MGTEFSIGEMTCVEAAKDGSTVRLSMTDAAGRPVSLVLPFACLSQLIMTLPGVARRALQLQRGDPSLRVVYPASEFRLELADDFETRILTLETPDGFSVSFGLSETQCRAIGSDNVGEVPRANFVN
jgi:hypothetical protein